MNRSGLIPIIWLVIICAAGFGLLSVAMDQGAYPARAYYAKRFRYGLGCRFHRARYSHR